MKLKHWRLKLLWILIGGSCVLLYLHLILTKPKWKVPICPLVLNNEDVPGATFSEVDTVDQIIPPATGYRVDCAAIMKGDINAIQLASRYKKCTPRSLSDDAYAQMTYDCLRFRRIRGYDSYYITPEEKDFPIAFNILTYENVEQTERLLRAIYRPQNYYCIHVDENAASNVKAAMTSIAACFDNVFMVSKPVAVRWSEFEVLEAEIHCMQDLVKKPKWKYFINLTGREFPLRTNWELVQIMTAYNGANDIDGTIFRRPLIWTKYVWRNQNWRTWTEKKPAPDGFLIAKGSTHIVATRGFVEYVVHNKSAHNLLEWMKDIRAPDEHFFPTLNHNPHNGVPGSYKENPDLKTFLARFKIWQSAEENCDGVWWRFICNFGVGDLVRLSTAKELFANKFRLEFDSLAFTCAEQWYLNRTRDFKKTQKDFDVGFYQKKPWVTNHV